MDLHHIPFYYLLLINIVGGIFFAVDKYKAKKEKWRIKEAVLHGFEAAGAVFFILFLMYIIHHKNRKASYYVVTYLILVLWCVFFYFHHDLVVAIKSLISF